MRAMVSGLVVLLVACVPPLSSAEGRACDAAHPCPDQLFCVELVCRVDDVAPIAPQTRTVLVDDCEAMGSWSLFGGGRFSAPISPPHAGAGACRLMASDGQSTEFGLESKDIPVQTGTYCATAFLAQGPIPARAVLTLRRFGGTGTTLVEESVAGAASTLLSDAGTTYRRLSASLPVDLANTAGVKVALSVEARVGSSVLFDEVLVTQTPPGGDAGCP